MRQYGLSKYKLIKLISRPERLEEGIAPGTLAVMQTATSYSKINPSTALRARKPVGEIWLMYKDTNPSNSSGQATRTIISAWRYPGISKPGEQIPIPKDIKEALEGFI